MKPVIPSDCFLIGGKAPDDAGFTRTYTGEAMSQQEERDGVSRRRVLQAAASIVPLYFGSHVAPALAQFGMAGTTQHLGDDLLVLGAREAVARIRSGDITAEAYVTHLLKQYYAHKDLNVANAIDGARVLEAARAVDRSRARGERLGPAAGLPFAVKDQISVAGYPTTGGNGALKGYIPKRHAVVVERLVTAGGIPFCMTSLPDMIVIDGLMHQVFSHSKAVRGGSQPLRSDSHSGRQ